MGYYCGLILFENICWILEVIDEFYDIVLTEIVIDIVV